MLTDNDEAADVAFTAAAGMDTGTGSNSASYIGKITTSEKEGS